MLDVNLVDLNKDELKTIKVEFYKYFEDPYAFEEFLKLFLEKLGLDEVEVTRRNKDGGIDLKAIKKGLDVLGDADTIRYYIQAKRYKPDNSIDIKDVRALRGVLDEGYKGIFITTARFTKTTEKFVDSITLKEIILIDGEKLIQKCIDLGVGFSCKPIFNSDSLDKFINSMKRAKPKEDSINERHLSNAGVVKNISKNDIRTRILPIPSSILEKIPAHADYFNVVFHHKDLMKLKINRERRYFGGVTDVYRKYGLIQEDNILNPKDSFWNIDLLKNEVNIEFDFQ